MRFQNMIIVVAATILAAPAFASAGAEQPRGAKAERKICRSLEATGTRMTKKACHTKAEWKKLERMQ